MKRLYLIIFIICYALAGAAQNSLTAVAFNCENAFDAVHDDGKNDYEYVSGGERRWGWKRMYRKLDGVAKVIAAIDTVQPVGLVALCEVENDSVLTYLTERTVLSKLGYSYVMTESADARGVDVALLYSKFQFLPVQVESIRNRDIDSPTRDVLHVAGIVASRDTLDVYVVHLPSKLGGRKGMVRSMKVARGLKCFTDSVMQSRSRGYAMVLGDFNAEFDSPQFLQALKAQRYYECDSLQSDILYDVIEGNVPHRMGTYKYKGIWSTIDHILVTGNVKVDDAGVLCSPFLLEEDLKYGGMKPKRTYVGYKYNGGISDHLPVWIRIDW